MEHVPQLHEALYELIRVCRKAVVITTPHEAKEIIEENIRTNIPHAHIHSFDITSFDFLKDEGYTILTKKY